MRITAVDAIPFTLDRRASLHMRESVSDRSRHVLVRVRTDAGPVGIGEALSKVSIYGETQDSIVAIIDQHLKPKIVGLDVGDLDEADHRLSTLPANNSARAALDIALHDLHGRTVGMSLAHLWGSRKIRQDVSYTVGINPPDTMAADALQQFEAHGIRAFKVKGGEDPERDVAALTAIRRAVSNAQLSLDANQGYTRHAAVRALIAMAPLELAYVEEPLPIADRQGRALLARQIPMPILGDDSCFTLNDVVREIELGAIGMVSIKTARTGFTESLRILQTAEAHGLTCIVGSAVGGGLSAAAALQFACRATSLDAPSENSFGLNLVSDILRESPPISGGAMTLPEGTGLGVDIDDDALARAQQRAKAGSGRRQD